MSRCYKILPVPSRTWSRVQGPCSLFIDNGSRNNALITIPLTGKVVSRSEIGHELAMLNKGNVLQHKNNSSNLTQKQRYALIAKGKWVNRTTWGTQSANGYTNPNIKNLQRVNYVSIPIDVGADEPIIIKDLGNLVCGTIENPVTGAVFTQPQGDLCFPSSFSDVPGPVTNLCWNDGIIPWYPKTRYTMSNSGDKFPINATLLNAVVIEPPTLSVSSTTATSISLSWQIPDAGLPITSFNVYQNFNLISTIIGTVDPETNLIVLPTTTIVTGLTSEKLYMFYVTAISNTRPYKTESPPSNIVTNSSQLFSVTGSPIQYTDGNQYILKYTNSGTISFLVNALSVTLFCGGGAGGGGGGAYAGGGAGGGGGGGGISTGSTVSTTGMYTVTVGTGGAGGLATNGSGTDGSNGLISSFTKSTTVYCIASGGGGGKGGPNNSSLGANGGASGSPGSVGGSGATRSSIASSGTLGGGGGGGSYDINSSGAHGSLNVSVTANGNSNTDFGAGGGGGLGLQNGYPGQGGNSNAGDGGKPGESGQPNTGGGGGGGQSGNGTAGSAYNGGSGGSGLVLLTFTVS
jgi:hypothetical protein